MKYIVDDLKNLSSQIIVRKEHVESYKGNTTKSVNCVEDVVVWLKQRYKKLSTENYVEGVLIVEMAHVIVQKRVRTVLEIVVLVLLPHHLRIVAMDRVMVVNPVRRVLEIVARVLPHHLQRIVGMVRAIMGKIVKHALVIVLEPTHVITVRLQHGKHLLG
jgi:hypothetical protein